MNQNKSQIVKELGLLGRLRCWRRTLIQARNMMYKSSSAKYWRTRMSALVGIKRPVFILGCPRSGTTFLGKVLEVLPNVSYYFEPPIMKYYTRLIYENKVSEGQVKRFYRRGSQALMLAAPGSGPRMIEKNPKHTWVAESLMKAFPDAQFVIISRDGRDVSLSLKEKPWHLAESLSLGRREPGGYLYGPYPHFYIEKERAEEYRQTSDIHRCIWIWRRYAEEIERLREVLPDEVQHHLTYEDLLFKPEETQDKLLTFLEEDDKESRRLVKAAASKGHTSSVGRGKQIFTVQEMEEIRNEAGAMLDKLGYL